MRTIFRKSARVQDIHAHEDPAADAAQVLLWLGIALLVIGVPAGDVMSRRLIFSLMPVGAVLVIAGALLAPRRRHTSEMLRPLLSPAGLAGLFLLAWTGLTLLWTPWPGFGIERYAKSFGTVLLAAIAVASLPGRTKAANLYLLPIGLGAAAIATALVGLQSPTAPAVPAPDIEGSILDRASIGLVMLVWPALAALGIRSRWIVAAVLAAATFVAVVVVWTPVALAALGLGALVFGLAMLRPFWLGRGLAGIAVLLLVGAPLLIVLLRAMIGDRSGGPAGFFGIVQVWADIVRHEGLRLVTGHGLDTSVRGVAAGLLPAAAPRSILFELWYELGIVGVLATAFVAARAFLAAARAPRPLAAFLMAELVSGLAIAISGVSTAQLWWVTLLGVAGIAFGIVRGGQYRTSRPILARFNVGSRPEATS